MTPEHGYASFMVLIGRVEERGGWPGIGQNHLLRFRRIASLIADLAYRAA